MNGINCTQTVGENLHRQKAVKSFMFAYFGSLKAVEEEKVLKLLAADTVSVLLPPTKRLKANFLFVFNLIFLLSAHFKFNFIHRCVFLVVVALSSLLTFITKINLRKKRVIRAAVYIKISSCVCVRVNWNSFLRKEKKYFQF